MIGSLCCCCCLDIVSIEFYKTWNVQYTFVNNFYDKWGQLRYYYRIDMSWKWHDIVLVFKDGSKKTIPFSHVQNAVQYVDYEKVMPSELYVNTFSLNQVPNLGFATVRPDLYEPDPSMYYTFSDGYNYDFGALGVFLYSHAHGIQLIDPV